MLNDISALVSLYACDRDIADRVLADRVFLQLPLPKPLAVHFKTVDTVGQLFESMPLGYVRQCIEQTALSPFERRAMLLLLNCWELSE